MYLKSKSDFNIEASETLIKSYLYAPSIHCSYYGCFQLMKYKLNKNCNCSYEDIDSIVRQSKRDGRPISEHKCVQDKIVKQLELVIKNSRIMRDFKNYIRDLYNFRVESDYKCIEIDHDKADKALRFAKDIISTLNKNIK